ncbi:MAG: VanZ family protein, partial [Candidatus Jettenia sp.]|nr:VanZ family protein [Candidatus Jettenia sp.]
LTIGFVYLKESKRMNIKIKMPWIFRCILALAYAYCIYIASSQDTSSVPLPPYIDKLIHFVEFGLLCFMICWSLSPVLMGTRMLYKTILAIGIASLYGMSDEFHQYFTPHRSVTISDWLADTTGAITAGFLWQLLALRRQTKEKLLTAKRNSNPDRKRINT